jgi:hypothetical protein
VLDVKNASIRPKPPKGVKKSKIAQQVNIQARQIRIVLIFQTDMNALPSPPSPAVRQTSTLILPNARPSTDVHRANILEAAAMNVL